MAPLTHLPKWFFLVSSCVNGRTNHRTQVVLLERSCVCVNGPTNQRTQVVLLVESSCVNGPTNHRTQVVLLGERVYVLCELTTRPA